ncbi:hypothetical protein B0H14DRAFT_1453721 [Mycena olivaceomarginata]|nr:hypothetical protein B0H14DRAFT_1453721 [Mycena olivaceomarginata]
MHDPPHVSQPSPAAQSRQTSVWPPERSAQVPSPRRRQDQSPARSIHKGSKKEKEKEKRAVRLRPLHPLLTQHALVLMRTAPRPDTRPSSPISRLAKRSRQKHHLVQGGRQRTLIRSASRHKATHQAIHFVGAQSRVCMATRPSGHPPECHTDEGVCLRLREPGKATEATEPQN